MFDRHLRTIAGAVVAGMLLLSSGCGQDAAPISGTMGTAAEPAPGTDALAGAPAEGSCFRMNLLQTASSTSKARPVSCYDKHTAMTYHVGLFPKGSNAADEKKADTTCERRLAKAVGIDKSAMRGTIFEHRWYEPTATQWEAGGRWFRCDVVATFDQKLRNLPGDTAPLFHDGEVEDAFERCINSNGSTEDGDMVTCNKPHDYRWSGVFTLPAKTPYPSQEKVLEWSQDRCREMVGTQNWWVTWPSELAWSTGEKLVACYANNSS